MLKSHKQTIFQTLGRHSIHPFPARMAPGIALDALSQTTTPFRVLDPMVGSGTVLAVARANGHQAYGRDLDPLAVLLAQVWTRTIDAEKVRLKSSQVLDRAKKRFRITPLRDAYPTRADDETRAFVRYWFDDYARQQLAALAIAIQRVRDRKSRDALWCAFSRLIIAKSAGASLAMDLSHSRPHRTFDRAPVKPFNRFQASVDAVVSNCPQRRSQGVGPPTEVRLGDARKLDISSGSIDLVLTSPPYLNAIDYLRCSKFSLVWMGYNICDLRTIRGACVGAEAASRDAEASEPTMEMIRSLRLRPPLATRDHALLVRYARDMERALAETARILKPSGRAIYVVGDSRIRGTFVRNSRIVTIAAEQHGLTLQAHTSRAIPPNRRYMPPPKRGGAPASMDGRMRREVVLVFQK